MNPRPLNVGVRPYKQHATCRFGFGLGTGLNSQKTDGFPINDETYPETDDLKKKKVTDSASEMEDHSQMGIKA